MNTNEELKYAAGNGLIEVVRRLMDAGANIDTRDSFGLTPLLWAAIWGRVEVVRLLLDNDATLTPMDYSWLRDQVDAGDLDAAAGLVVIDANREQ